MMTTLYRHYRPQIFAELVGQPHVVETLRQAVLKNRLAHAYLLYGPRGTGKTTTARILAKRINCTTPNDAEPCLHCVSCLALQANRHLDVIEIDAASNRGIDDIRALRETVATAPSLGKYKVYIVDEVHMLTKEAATALLKTLEEPAKHVLFILATTELHKVLPTITSRCQLFRFRRASDHELRGRLQQLLAHEQRTADDAALTFIISRSDGCYRDAESLLGQLLTLHEKHVTKDDLTEFLGLPPMHLIEQFVTALVRSESSPALAAVDEAFSTGYDPEQFLKESTYAARDGAVAIATSAQQLPVFAQEPHAAERLPTIIRALLQALQDLAYVPQPMIALQLAIITVCMKRGYESTASRHTAKPQQATTPRTTQPQQTPAQDLQPTPVQEQQAKRIQVDVTQVVERWSDLIQQVKNSNPVAATFLRAIEPVAIEDGTVRLRARYALHRNFFNKPANKKLVETTLSEVLSTGLTILCELVEADQSLNAATQQPHDDKLYQAAQEVFGKVK